MLLEEKDKQFAEKPVWEIPNPKENISSIKKANTPDEVISKAEFEFRVKEISKCKKDIVYFANTYFKILSMNDGIRTIELYPRQKELLKFFKDEKRAICLSARQSGKTSMYTIYLLWLCCFHPEKKAMILANKAATAIEIVSRIQLGYEYLPAWLKPKVLIWNKGQIMFANKSEIRAFASASDAARGFSANCVEGSTLVTVMDQNGVIEEKRIDAIVDSKWKKILTENGFKAFDGIKVSNAKKIVVLKTKSNKLLKCTEDHRIKLKSGSFVYAKDIKIGDVLSTNDEISGKQTVNKNCKVYDALNVKDGNEYLTNRITSHNCVVIDEFAFLPKNVADRLFTSIYPTISSSKEGKMIIVSTPNGIEENLYYDIWQKANATNKDKNEEGWKPFEMRWWDVPGRDEKFKEMTIASIGQRRWDQEFACEFLSTSDFRKLIPEDILEKFKMRLDQYKLQEADRGVTMQITSQDETKVFNFTMWECFDRRKTYLASGDVAEGTGNDSSVIYIWDVTDLSKISLVCKFAANDVSILEFAFVCNKILRLYACPPFAIENNSCGSGLIDVLRINYQYGNMVKEGAANNPYGIRSHSSVKPKACLWLRDMFTTQGFDWILKDAQLLKEIGSFVRRESKSGKGVGSYSAMSGAHDDLMMSLVWAAYLLQPEVAEKYFIVADYFTSSLGVIYPKLLQPGMDYDKDELLEAYNSPYFKEFQETELQRKKDKAESEEVRKQIAEKERELKEIEARIQKNNGRWEQFKDPFNPANLQQEQTPGRAVEGFWTGGMGNSNSFDFDGGTW